MITDISSASWKSGEMYRLHSESWSAYVRGLPLPKESRSYNPLLQYIGSVSSYIPPTRPPLPDPKFIVAAIYHIGICRKEWWNFPVVEGALQCFSFHINVSFGETRFTLFYRSASVIAAMPFKSTKTFCILWHSVFFSLWGTESLAMSEAVRKSLELTAMPEFA